MDCPADDRLVRSRPGSCATRVTCIGTPSAFSRLRFEYCVGGGGGHELYIENFCADWSSAEASEGGEEEVRVYFGQLTSEVSPAHDKVVPGAKFELVEPPLVHRFFKPHGIEEVVPEGWAKVTGMMAWEAIRSHDDTYNRGAETRIQDPIVHFCEPNRKQSRALSRGLHDLVKV